MKYLPLVWRNLLRKKFRTTFTVLAIMVSFLMYGVSMTLKTAFSMGVSVAGIDRLMMTNKVSIIQPLPMSYLDKIKAVPGVTLATHSSWFGGVYQDPTNQFPQFPVDPESFMKMYPEFQLPADQMKAWLADKQGVVVGADTMKRFGWKIGDRIPLQATIWQPKSGTWEFNIVGVYDGKTGIDKTQFLFRYDYFDEHRRNGEGLVGWYLIRIANPNDAPTISNTLDALFANSTYETKTATEAAMMQSWANQVGNIGAIIVYILIVVFFTIVLIVANTMAQAVRERTNELAALKALGFSNGLIMALVLGESLTISVVAGGIGLGLAWLFASGGDPTHGYLPIFMLPNSALALGALLTVLLGLAAGAMPAAGAMRLRITDAMRRN